jgi:hypothetical protein
MLPSTTPATSGNTHRNKSHKNDILRTKSQPPTDTRYRSVASSNSSTAHPMKNLIGNLLHLTPHRYVSSLNTSANRSKISSSLSTAFPSNRSSRIRFAHTSIVSSMSIHSETDHPLYGVRVYFLIIFFLKIFIDVFLASND